MYYTQDEILEVQQELDYIKQGMSGLASPMHFIPALRAYKEIGQRYLDPKRNMLKTAFIDTPTIASKYALRQTLWTTATFAPYIFKDIGMAGGRGTIKWMGAFGLRGTLGRTASVGRGFMGGRFTKLTSFMGKLNKVVVGGEVSVARLAKLGMDGKYAKIYGEFFEGLGDISNLSTKAKLKYIDELKNKVVKSIATKGVKEAEKKGMEQAAEALAFRLKAIHVGAGAIKVGSKFFNAYQVSSMIANIGASMVKVGYGTSELVRHETRRFMQKSRLADFESDLSAFSTVAAKTERTALLEHMFTSRTNGAMPYGNETDTLGGF